MVISGYFRVCFITSSFINESYGGVQNFVLDFSKWLIKKSIKSVIISTSFQAFAKSVIFEIDYGVTQVKRGKFFFVKYIPSMIRSFIFAIMALLEIIRQNREFNFSIFHAQDVFVSGLVGVMARKLFRIPLVVHAHGISPYFFEAGSEANKPQRILARCLAKIVINNSDLLIATDAYTKNILTPFISKAKSICIPTPIDTGIYFREGKPCTKVRKSWITLGFIGRLSPQKNLRTLLSAFTSARTSSNEKLKLVIVGDGPEIDFLMREVKRLKIPEDVIFTGAVSESKKLELLGSFDIFILPSLYEGCPIALLEAMACGKAIISSDIPSIREILGHGKEALLVNPHSVKELQQAILLLSKNPFLRNLLGNNALERVKMYDIDNIFNRILEIYKALIRYER